MKYVENCGKFGQATDGNTIWHTCALCMLDNGHT
jgi:hypothetical protein